MNSVTTMRRMLLSFARGAITRASNDARGFRHGRSGGERALELFGRASDLAGDVAPVLHRRLLLGGEGVGQRADEPQRRTERLLDGGRVGPGPLLLREKVGHPAPDHR